MKGTGPLQPSDDVFAQAMEDSKVVNLDANKMTLVSKLAVELKGYYDLWNTLIDQIEECDANIHRLEDRELPAAMYDLGMTDFGLVGGGRVAIEKTYVAGIKVEDRQTAFQWMREHNHEALIKAEVKIGFGKGDVERAARLADAVGIMIGKKLHDLQTQLVTLESELQTEGGEEERKQLEAKIIQVKEDIAAYSVSPELEQSVHWQTLRAWVKEQVKREEKEIEEGELDPEKDAEKLLPRQLLGIHVFDKAKVAGLPKRKANKYEHQG